ncbi:hypothetical protein Apa02nite_064260 [Actinoplanes palleronii]|uniref:Uncharacterized protein n=1 Tax=Actinoplanes palleronii TaxID=113570 RepID=A0ABQ4BI34_9ACTN|nr:hypothetical protein Apa02nite_064260 [Actinoplanes palleronii]
MGCRQSAPSRNAVTELLLLMPTIMLASSTGNIPPGPLGGQLTTVPCPYAGCADPARQIPGRHAGLCETFDRLFLWCVCPCGGTAYRTVPGSRWQCNTGLHSFDGHLCPHCWGLGQARAGLDPRWLRCHHDGTWFYVTTRGCPSCQFGNLVRAREGGEQRCESCTEPPPGRR